MPATAAMERINPDGMRRSGPPPISAVRVLGLANPDFRIENEAAAVLG